MSTAAEPGGSNFSAIEKRIEIFRTAGQAQRDNLDELLGYCQSLLDDIRLLRGQVSAQQALVNSPNKNQKHAAAVHSGTNASTHDHKAAYVAVLVDGDHHQFRNDLIEAQYPGGMTAGEQLRESIAELLHDTNIKDWDGGDVVAWVYADLARLARHTNHSTNYKLDELRQFFAGFTGSFTSFEFVDAGESEGSAAAKIQRMLRLFINDPNCKHVFLAIGCSQHDIAMLDSFGPKLDQVSLVRPGSDNAEIKNVPCKVVGMSNVFQATGVAAAAEHRPEHEPESESLQNAAANGWAAEDSKLITTNDGWHSTTNDWNTSTNNDNDDNTAPASDWNKNANGWDQSQNDTTAVNSNWGDNNGWPNTADNAWESKANHKSGWKKASASIAANAASPYRLDMGDRRRGSVTSSSASSSHTASKSSKGSKPLDSTSSSSRTSNSRRGYRKRPADIARHLERFRSSGISEENGERSVSPSKKKDYIPVNSNNERVDEPIANPSDAALGAYFKLSHRPCKFLHVGGYCQFGSDCVFDHQPLSQDVAQAMAWELRSQPCLLGPACRWKQCVRGHICTRPACTGSPKSGCRMPIEAHGVDKDISKWVRAASDEHKQAVRDTSRTHSPSTRAPSVPSWSEKGVTAASNGKAFHAEASSTYQQPFREQPIQPKGAATSSRVRLSSPDQAKAAERDWYLEQFGSTPPDTATSWDPAPLRDSEPALPEQQSVQDGTAVPEPTTPVRSGAGAPASDVGRHDALPGPSDLIDFSSPSSSADESVTRKSGAVKQNDSAVAATSVTTSKKKAAPKSAANIKRSTRIPQGTWSPGQFR